MRRLGSPFKIAGILSLALMSLCSCSGHHSFPTEPSAGSYIPATTNDDAAVKRTTLRVTDLDGDVEASGTQDRALPIVNGSRLRISLTGDNVLSAAVEAGDSSARLEPAGDGRWTAVIRYLDSSNPPAQNPFLEVQMQTSAGGRAFRIPVTELHQ
jgi:hypothetical protein